MTSQQPQEDCVFFEEEEMGPPPPSAPSDTELSPAGKKRKASEMSNGAGTGSNGSGSSGSGNGGDSRHQWKVNGLPRPAGWQKEIHRHLDDWEWPKNLKSITPSDLATPGKAIQYGMSQGELTYAIREHQFDKNKDQSFRRNGRNQVLCKQGWSGIELTQDEAVNLLHVLREMLRKDRVDVSHMIE